MQIVTMASIDNVFRYNGTLRTKSSVFDAPVEWYFAEKQGVKRGVRGRESEFQEVEIQSLQPEQSVCLRKLQVKEMKIRFIGYVCSTHCVPAIFCWWRVKRNVGGFEGNVVPGRSTSMIM